MVKSSSIFTAFPNMKMYCMRFANSHMLRSRWSRLGSGAGSDDSISSRPRFRETILRMFFGMYQFQGRAVGASPESGNGVEWSR